MTESIQFVFSRQRLLALGLCSFVVAILLFVAGLATGWLLHPLNSTLSRQSIDAASQPGTPSRASAAKPETALAPADASSQADSDGSASGVIVDVASFDDKAKAANLASILKREGFEPVHTGQYESGGQTLFYVRVGPFRAWDDASCIAQKLDQSFDLHTSVIPAKAAS